jgi:hypothetical protein
VEEYLVGRSAQDLTNGSDELDSDVDIFLRSW